MKRGKIMQAIISAILAFIMTILSSCGFIIPFDRNEISNNIIQAIETRDVDALEDMMCPALKKTDNLRGKIEALFDAVDAIDGKVDGKFVEFKSNGGDTESDESGFGRQVNLRSWSLEYKSDTGNYSLNITWFIKNTDNPDFEGMKALCLIGPNGSIVRIEV
jgi:hypothetical protein